MLPALLVNLRLHFVTAHKVRLHVVSADEVRLHYVTVDEEKSVPALELHLLTKYY